MVLPCERNNSFHPFHYSLYPCPPPTPNLRITSLNNEQHKLESKDLKNNRFES